MALKKKILLVDDDPDVLYTTKVIIERGGHEVVTAGSGVECIQKIKDLNPDLVLLDIIMPVVNGIDTLKILREDEELNSIPIAMFTAMDTDDRKIKALENKANWYITKPCGHNELLEKVNWLLESTPII